MIDQQDLEMLSSQVVLCFWVIQLFCIRTVRTYLVWIYFILAI